MKTAFRSRSGVSAVLRPILLSHRTGSIFPHFSSFCGTCPAAAPVFPQCSAPRASRRSGRHIFFTNPLRSAMHGISDRAETDRILPTRKPLTAGPPRQATERREAETARTGDDTPAAQSAPPPRCFARRFILQPGKVVISRDGIRSLSSVLGRKIFFITGPYSGISLRPYPSPQRDAHGLRGGHPASPATLPRNAGTGYRAGNIVPKRRPRPPLRFHPCRKSFRQG